MSDYLWPHELQHTRPPCPSPTHGVYSNSCPLSWWCHPTISSSVIPFSSCLQSFPASGSFPMSQLFVVLELSCFFNDPAKVGNLISGSSAFSKSSLNIWKFIVHVLLKPGLENFEHYFTSVWDECNCAVVWAFFGIAFLWNWNENWPFPVCDHCWVFQICWHIECSTFTASSFRIWNSSTGIPSPPIALFVGMLPKAHLTSHSRMSVSSWVITPLWLSGLWRFFLYSSSVYSCHFLLISSASVKCH